MSVEEIHNYEKVSIYRLNADDQETKEWFYPTLARALRGEGEVADKFAEFLDSPLRVVLEVDTVRLEAELKRRGLGS